MGTSFKKTGIITSYEFSDTFPIQDMKTEVLSDNSTWALVFEHNCVGGTVKFTSYNEVMNTQTANKYSRLNILDKFKGSDGKFEFMLKYPDDTTAYNRWKQTNNPCKEFKGYSDSSLTVDGYEAVSIAWTGNAWGGLNRQNSDETDISPCFLSGTVGHSNWYYAIGASSSHVNGMPTYNNGSTAGRVQLWVRTDKLPNNNKFSIYNKCITSNNFIEI